MHDVARWSVRRLTIVLFTLSLGLVACGGTASSSGAAGVSSAAPAASTDTGGGGTSGEASVTGSLVSSGLYDATWTWVAGNAAGPGIGGITVNSDKGTFGNIQVLPDGSITFTSGAPELTSGSYTGTGGQVHMKDQIPCGFTLDNDVTGTDGVLHLKGTMDVVGGAFAC